jgi:hypothetical protein
MRLFSACKQKQGQITIRLSLDLSVSVASHVEALQINQQTELGRKRRELIVVDLKKVSSGGHIREYVAQ